MESQVLQKTGSGAQLFPGNRMNNIRGKHLRNLGKEEIPCISR